jgi:hypothetical protein
MLENFKEYRERVHQTKAARMGTDLIYRVERTISVHISYLLLQLFPRLSPNYISIINVLLVWAVFSLNFTKGLADIWLLSLIQLGLLKVAAIGDKVDGEIARHQNHFTQKGIYYDLTFHFFYSFVFVVSVGYSFAIALASSALLLWVVAAGFLMAYYRILGKLRHHIQYKIKLEAHQNNIQDFVAKAVVAPSERSWLRFINYLLFFIYDWVWLWYLVLIILIWRQFNFAACLYLAHLFLTTIVLLVQILIIYPRRHLFTLGDLE